MLGDGSGSVCHHGGRLLSFLISKALRAASPRNVKQPCILAWQFPLVSRDSDNTHLVQIDVRGPLQHPDRRAARATVHALIPNVLEPDARATPRYHLRGIVP